MMYDCEDDSYEDDMYAFSTMRMYSIMFLYAPSFCQETIIMCSYNSMTSYSIITF